MSVDRFGNPHAPNLSYARGDLLRSAEDDFRKLQVAWSLIRERGVERIYIFTGLEHGLRLAPEELQFADERARAGGNHTGLEDPRANKAIARRILIF